MRAPTLLLSLTVAGCTVGPDYVRPDVDIPAGWRTAKADAEDIANTAWWSLFEDPVLDGLIRTALASNKDVHLAAARIDEFAARIGIADAAARPQVDFGASAARERASAELPGGIPAGIGRTNEFYAATINVGWELDVWGRIRRASEAARAELLEADEGRRTVLLTLVSSVATSYIELRSLDKQLDIANRTLESRDETLRLFELQRAGGVVSDLEVAQIRSEYEQAALQIPFIEQQIALLENSISVLLGRNPGPIDRGRSIDDLVLPPIPFGVPSDLLTRRPDIRSAEQSMIAANARIGEARAAFFPRIALTGFFGAASDDLSNLVTSSAAVWSAGGSLLTVTTASGPVRPTT